MMRVALFSDVHGHLRVVLHVMRSCQRARRELLGGALLAGDVGLFPDLTRLDRATLRWMEKDPEEAGFSRHFLAEDPFVREALDGPEGCEPFDRVAPLLLLTPGNHEDYPFLEEKGRLRHASHAPANTFPVDYNDSIHVIRNGAVATLRGEDGSTLRVASLWGIENAKPGSPYAIQEDAARSLMHLGEGAFDLLLTHDAPQGAFPGMSNSVLVADVLGACQPAFHLFGHVHPRQGQHEYAIHGARTKCYLLENLTFGHRGQDSLARAVAILEWGQGCGRIEVLDEPWLRKMTRTTWQYVQVP